LRRNIWQKEKKTTNLAAVTPMYKVQTQNQIVPAVFDSVSPLQSHSQQDCQALLKAKYCPRVAAIASAGSNKVAPSSE